MSAKRKRMTRRKRRSARAVMKHGRKAKPKHQLKTGRTGGVHHKHLKSLQDRAKLMKERE